MERSLRVGAALFVAVASAALVGKPCHAQSIPSIAILSPIAGSVVQRGQLVDVHLTLILPSRMSDVVVLGRSLESQVSASASADVSVQVRIDASAAGGAFALNAIAVVDGMAVVAAPPVRMIVAGPVGTALLTDPSKTLTFVGQSTSLQARLSTPSGVELVPPSLLIFSSSDSAVATVSPGGGLTARSQGTATVSVRYPQAVGDLTASVMVSVTGHVPGDLDGDGQVTAVDRAYLASWAGAPVLVPNDGRDLNGDGAIDQLDVNVLQSSCVPSCQAPLGIADTYTVASGATLDVPAPGLLANDAANGGSGLTAYLSAQPAGGALALQANGAFRYTPSTGFSGSDSFRYRPSTVSGGVGAEVAVALAVTPPPPPIATNDAYSTAVSVPLSISAPGVLANDNANGGAALSAVLSSAATVGTVALSPGGGFVYTPTQGFSGIATFQYRAQTTNGGQSTPATVSITVNSAQLPTGVDDAYVSASGADLNIAAPGVLANDSANGAGPLTSQVVTTPLHGTVTLSADGGFLYRPVPGYAGLDSFTYRPSSAFGPGTLATVRITLSVTPVPPTSVADSYDVAVNGTLTVPAPGVLANDLANGGGPLLADVSRIPQHGSLTLGSNGAVTYRPTAGFSGLDTFTYRARTASGGAGNEATVTVRVQTTVPQPPTDFRVARVDGRDVTFVWTAPTTGPTPFGYQLEGGLAPGQTLGVIPAGTGEAVRLTLPVGAFYVRLRTLTLPGLSTPSPDIAIQVGLANPPSAPASLVGMASGGRLGLAWTPTFDGGVPTTAVLDVTGAFVGSLNLGGTDRFEFPLVPPGQYTFTVRQVNAFGTSVASNAVTLAFPGGCSGAPAAPARLRALQSGGRVTVFWDPPASGAAPSSYLLSVSGGLNATVPMTEREVSAPVPSGTYTLTVAGANACGTGPASAAHTFTVQ